MALLRLSSEGHLMLGGKRVQNQQNILLLVDTSGSMAGLNRTAKIEQAKAGAIDFAQSVTLRGCAVALAIFGDTAAMVCDLTIDSDKFTRKIKGLSTGLVGGTTNLAAGLSLASKFRELHAVVVVTDGQPNSEPAALEAADVIKARGIDILCIGTDDANRDFLSKLATRSDLAIHVRAEHLRESIGQASRLMLTSGNGSILGGRK